MGDHVARSFLLLEGDLLLVHGLDTVLVHFRRNQALHEQISENTLAGNFKPALCCGALVEPAVQRLCAINFWSINWSRTRS